MPFTGLGSMLYFYTDTSPTFYDFLFGVLWMIVPAYLLAAMIKKIFG